LIKTKRSNHAITKRRIDTPRKMPDDSNSHYRHPSKRAN
jgi:hypothetical protein